MNKVNEQEIYKEAIKKRETYQSNYWKTESWNIRWWAMFDTYRTESIIDKDKKKIEHLTEFFLDTSDTIVWFKSDQLINWKAFWDETKKIIKELWIWNTVKHIIENNKYEDKTEFLKELNIAYSSRLDKY